VRLSRGTLALISGFGDDGVGGIYAFDGTSVTRFDDLPSAGAAVGQGHVARALRTADDPERPAEVLKLTESGEIVVRGPRPGQGMPGT
jgi:hypothetical protein